jgi:hypothetical protein
LRRAAGWGLPLDGSCCSAAGSRVLRLRPTHSTPPDPTHPPTHPPTRTGVIGAREFTDRFFAIFGPLPGAEDLFIQMALLVPNGAKRLGLLQLARDVRRGARRGLGGRASAAPTETSFVWARRC